MANLMQSLAKLNANQRTNSCKYPPGDSHSGLDNYYRLRNTVLTATGLLNQDGTLNPNPPQAAVAARDQLINFINVTRSGIDQLAALNSVYYLYYMSGENWGDNWPYTDSPILTGEWATSLIHTGKVTINQQGTIYNLDLGLTEWKCSKLRHNSAHDSHLHIMLNRAVIGDL